MKNQIEFPLAFGLSKTGLPLIIVSMFNQEICLLLDTGSNKNILDGRVYQCFKEHSGNSPSESLIGLSGGSGGFEVDIPFLFEQISYCEPFLCVESIEGFDAVREDTGVQIHGILGNRFFLEHNWVLDFDKMVVSF